MYLFTIEKKNHLCILKSLGAFLSCDILNLIFFWKRYDLVDFDFELE